MMLNPTKCAYDVGLCKFLGLMVSKRGIEANPDKIKVIIDMKAPTSLKKFKKLTGGLQSLEGSSPNLEKNDYHSSKHSRK